MPELIAQRQRVFVLTGRRGRVFVLAGLRVPVGRFPLLVPLVVELDFSQEKNSMYIGML